MFNVKITGRKENNNFQYKKQSSTKISSSVFAEFFLFVCYYNNFRNVYLWLGSCLFVIFHVCHGALCLLMIVCVLLSVPQDFHVYVVFTQGNALYKLNYYDYKHRISYLSAVNTYCIQRKTTLYDTI